MMPRLAIAAALALATALPARAAEDPFEAANRRVHAFNMAVRSHVLAPVAEFTIAHVPAPVRQGTARALANLGEPVTAAAALAAGEFDVAANAMARFGINATLGLGGIRDAATGMGYAPHPFTLADTACRWGVPSGPYLVLPLLGPSTLRDAGAQAVSGTLLSQLVGSDAVLAWGGADALVGYVGLHPTLERLEAESLDAYATLRSATLQRRAAACPVDQAALMREEAE